MSVESGFKTFRGSDGLWEEEPVEKVASHEGWLMDPVYVNDFYNRLRKKLFAAQPNTGHRLIAELEDRYDVTVITQNVDNLHEKAGSSHIIHLHGELTKVCSSRDQFDERYVRELGPDDPDIQAGEIIGTSLVVYPAAGLVHYVKPGTPIYLIDPENVSTAGIPNLTHIRKGASEGMRQLVELLP